MNASSTNSIHRSPAVSVGWPFDIEEPADVTAFLNKPFPPKLQAGWDALPPGVYELDLCTGRPVALPEPPVTAPKVLASEGSTKGNRGFDLATNLPASGRIASEPAAVGTIPRQHPEDALDRADWQEWEWYAFHRLFFGGEPGQKTPSEDDLLLACLIVKGKVRDPEQVEQIMRAAEIARVGPRQKWDANRRYLQRTIAEALKRTPENGSAPASRPKEAERAIHAYSDVEILALPDPEWLVDGLLLKGGLTLLVGRYGAGKSFLALDWAMHVAGGMAWQGRAVRRGPVLYVYGEGSLKTRVAAWRSAHRVEMNKALGVAFVPGTVNLLDETAVTKLLAWIGEGKPAVIVFDTLSRMTPGGDENDSETAGQLIGATGRIQRETGAAVLLLHHTPWAADQQRPRGHSKVADAADGIFLLENDGGALKLTCQKQREGEAPPPLHLKLTPQDGALVVDEGARPAGPMDRIVGALTEGERVNKSELARRLSVSRRTVSRWLTQAEDEGLVVSHGSGTTQTWALGAPMKGGARPGVPGGGQVGMPSNAHVPSQVEDDALPF